MACRLLSLFVVVSIACIPDRSNTEAIECTADEDCEPSCVSSAERFGAAHTSSPQLQAQACESIDFIIGNGTGEEQSIFVEEACYCSIDGAEGIMLLHGEDRLGCLNLGHAGHCLYSPAEFAGCERGNARSCDDACALLEQRLLQDAQTSYVVDVVSAACDGGSCACEWRVDDACFDNDRVHGPCDAP